MNPRICDGLQDVHQRVHGDVDHAEQEGDPGVRVHTFCESEGLWTGLGCVEPSTFSYTNDGPGLIQLLEGEATVTLDGRTLDLRAGDVVIVPGSVEQTWEIKTAVREFFVTFATARPTV